MMNVKIIRGDSIDVMASMTPESVATIITDPPYGIKFMGKDWDAGVPGVAYWRKALMVCKPGAFLLAFGGTRTFHRLTCAIEDAGWEIRDCVLWLYGSGFPKSLDVSKAIDKAARMERAVVGSGKPRGSSDKYAQDDYSKAMAGKPFDITAPATDEAKLWQGYGTALKPAWEPIIVARKRLDGTVADNVLKHGTGALNIDGGRIPTNDNTTAIRRSYGFTKNTEKAAESGCKGKMRDRSDPVKKALHHSSDKLGRWPANLIHDGSEEVVSGFPETGPSKAHNRGLMGKTPFSKIDASGLNEGTKSIRGHSDTRGSASRFFYTAKASQSQRGEGNNHPTVKPLALLEYLVKLTKARTSGTVLDPFMGSGTTGIACQNVGVDFVGIEINADYCDIARKRLSHGELFEQ